MKDVLKLAEEISDVIVGSSLYQDYVKAYNNIKKDEKLMSRINKIKKEHIEFAQNYKNGNRDFGREKYLSQEFYKLMLDEDVKTYFMNEDKLVDTISSVYNIISTRCELQLLEQEQ